MKITKIRISGNPIPLKRPRFSPISKKVFDIQKPEKKIYKSILKKYWKREPIDTPVSLIIDFFMPIPYSMSIKKRKEILDEPHCKKPDIDNLIKFVLDCMNDIVFLDDALVHSICAHKVYSDFPRTDLSIFRDRDLEEALKGKIIKLPDH